MIEIQNLTRRYGDLVAVNDVTVSVAGGEIVGLLGHNGAGKTTVMKILTGFLEPTSGTVRVGGVDVVADRRGVQRQIGYLPESAPLYPEMTVQDYLLMMADLRGVPADRQEAAVVTAARDTGLIERLTQRIGTLSKGYRQRVGIAQAILHSPDVLVLDEPTNGLDPLQIHAIRELVKRLGQKTTIVLSTHILQEIEAVCERVLVMIDGHLAADAPLHKLLASNRLIVSIAAGTTGVEAALQTLPGVSGVRALGPDAAHPGFERFVVEHGGDPQPGPAVARVVRERGWSVAAIAPESRTLESVFEELQEQHIARHRKEASA
jgi:ABC-2 type transport system ATP-binding protein